MKLLLALIFFFLKRGREEGKEEGEKPQKN
jgi:hypothetical protein